jgi:hypothetical protein
MSAPLPACWRGEEARRVLVTEALEGGDAIFLATHTPIRGFDVERGGGEIDGNDEQAILDALAHPERKHAFCVVQGEPGSGKSHLIRWLSVNWPVARDVKLLLRRADGSLEGALRQLKERLPSEFESLFDNLGQRQSANVQGRANVFALTLTATLEPDHFSKPIGSEEFCSQFAPADLIGHTGVRRAWNGPVRILGLLEGRGGERNSETASFNLFDIEDLAQACIRARPTAIDHRALELSRRLQKEGETIRSYRQEGWLADEIAVEAKAHLATSLELMRALNLRRNEAIRNVMGVSAEGLKTLFRNLREALAPRGQRLVLLLEDITSWEGLDDSLIDVLIDNAEAQGDGTAKICPLISVVGVTPDFYEKLPGNNRQRITNEIRLGQSHGGLQDVATMRDSENRLAFVARYLAAVRAGLPALEGWREDVRRDPETPVPNVCVGCSRQETCFSVFGAADGVGLFPFTAHALERFFEALKENDNGQTWRTPRGVLQAVLSVNLTQPESIEQRRFPTPIIEGTAIREDRRSERVLANRLERFVSTRIAGEAEQSRMRRMLAFWADPARADTTEEDGELAFAGAKRSLFEAFGLDWIGADSASAEPATAPVKPDEPSFELPPEDVTAPSPVPAPAPATAFGRRPAARDTAPPIIVPKPKRLTANRSQLEQYQHELRHWAKGGSIANASSWNKLLFEILQQADPRRLGVSKHLFDRLVTAEMVKLQGSTTATRKYLMLDAEQWVRDGLEAYLALKLDKALTHEDAGFHRRNLAVMMRRLEKVAAAYVDARMPKLDSGERWSPAAGIAQVLVARAWLRGTIAPESSVPEHLTAILSDEPEVLSDPRARSQPWQDWLSATDKWHEHLRTELRSMISLSIGDGAGGAGLVDVSEVAPAIQSMRETGRADSVPANDGGLPNLLCHARELAGVWREKKSVIDRTEVPQLKNRAESLFKLLRDRSVDDHLARIDAAVTNVSALMPGAAPDLVSGWKRAYSQITPRLKDGANQRVEEFISLLDDPESGPPPNAARRLGWMARAPAKDLADLLELSNQGEKLVGVLHDHVSDCLREASGAGSLATVRGIGARLKAASRLEHNGGNAA